MFVILIPLLLDGWPTLPTVLALCSFVTVITFVVLGGVNRKTVCAILGTIMGVALAMLFGKFACWLLRIDGYKMYVAVPTVEPLLQLRQTQGPAHALRLADLLVGGILLAALGAVNDVAMSISSAMNELIAVNPSLTRRQLFKSGMNIGRDMVGTMTNTLILALVGGSFAMIIYYTSMEPSWVQLMSTTFLSVEMVQALASSIGVILAVPFSVVIGMLLFGMRPKKAKNKEKSEALCPSGHRASCSQQLVDDPAYGCVRLLRSHGVFSGDKVVEIILEGAAQAAFVEIKLAVDRTHHDADGELLAVERADVPVRLHRENAVFRKTI